MARAKIIQVRRVGLALAAVLPIGAGVAVLNMVTRREQLASVSTIELFSLLGLFVLPLVTYAAMRLDTKWRRLAARRF